MADGRHPVVEEAIERDHAGAFVGNDCTLSDDDSLIWLLTGPNMAGKSTFLRQNAIIAVMAQMGSFVPCKSAHIGVIDKIFLASALRTIWRAAVRPLWLKWSKPPAF